MNPNLLPQYLRIAISIAAKIANGEYPEQKKISGLSKISSEYGVSPETARKAVQLLSDMKIVETREKSGVLVISSRNARMYLESVKYRKEQYELREKMQDLLNQYYEIGQEIASTGERLLVANMQALPSDQPVPTFEITVGEDSDKIGRTIGSVKFWQATGCTIIAIRRGQNLMVAPNPYSAFKKNDVVVCAGLPENKQIAEVYLNTTTDPSVHSADEYHDFWAMAINKDIIEENTLITDNICTYFDCEPEEIKHIVPMQQGLNNQSYSFVYGGRMYVYRHPGVNASHIIDRVKEAKALKTAKALGIDDTLLYIDDEKGWKISRFIETTEPFDFSDKRHAAMLASHLKTLNESNVKLGFSFDYETESDKLLSIIREKNVRKYEVLLPIREKMHPAFELLRNDPWQHSMCHNDLYEPNLMVDGDMLHIIDWEFAGDTDIGFDICKLFSLQMPSYENIDEWLSLYYGNDNVTDSQKLHLIACAAVIYYYWFIWALYADENGAGASEYIPEWNKKREYYIQMLEERIEE